GTNFLTMREFVRKRFGDGGWERVLAKLPAEDRQMMASLLAVGWYPTRSLLRLMQTVDETLSPDGGTLMGDFGRYAAEHDLTVIHRAFLRLASPVYVLEKSMEYWGRFHQRGHWVITRNAAGAIGTLEGFVPDERFCASLGPYIARMF